jgi:hypothetical protein
MYPKMQEQEFQQVLDTCPVWVRGILETHKDEILQGRIPSGIIVESAGGPAPTRGDQRGTDFAMYAERRFDGWCPMYASPLILLGRAIGESIALKGLLDAYEVRKAEQEKKAQEEVERKAKEDARMQAESDAYYRRKAEIAKQRDEQLAKDARAVKCEAMSRLRMSYCTTCYNPHCWVQLQGYGVKINQLPYFCACSHSTYIQPDKKQVFPGAGPNFELAVIAQMEILREKNKNVRTDIEAQRRINIVIESERRIELEAKRRILEIKKREAAEAEEAKIQQRVRELLERNE